MTTVQPLRCDSLVDLDPNDLVARARSGCDEAYGELARRYFPRLVQLVLPRLRSNSHMDAEDIAQDSLARAFQNIESFDPRFRFSTWLFTIAIRIACDHNRGHRRRLSLLQTHSTLLGMEIAKPRLLVERVELQESVDAIWLVARRTLGEAHYTAMWLRFAEDLSVAEIAQVMRKTQVGVRVLLHRARLKMLKVMQEPETQPSSSNRGEAV